MSIITGMKKAIKIDAHNRTITEVEVDGLTDMQAVVEGNIEVATEIVFKKQTESVYVNEEGLFEPHNDWFVWKGAHQPFKGNGLVIGFKPSTGDSCSTKMTVADVQNFVKFVDASKVAEIAEMV